jgi:CDGSH-type Zn-finger protein
MQLCDGGHDEVCFEGYRTKCPVCEAMAEAQKEIEDLKAQIENLEKEE